MKQPEEACHVELETSTPADKIKSSVRSSMHLKKAATYNSRNVDYGSKDEDNSPNKEIMQGINRYTF